MFVRKSTTIFQNSWLWIVKRLFGYEELVMSSGSTLLQTIFQKSELVVLY
jgi:hypothetical protein